MESKENTKQTLDEKWKKKKTERECAKGQQLETIWKGFDGDYGKGTRSSKTMNKTRIIRHRRLIIRLILSTKLTWFKSSKDMIKFHFTWLDPTHSNEQYPPLRLIIQKRAFDFVAQSKARRSTPPHSKLSICFKFFNRLSQMNVCYAHFSSIYFFQDI